MPSFRKPPSRLIAALLILLLLLVLLVPLVLEADFGVPVLPDISAGIAT